jgi:hypothetical protein
MNVEESFDEHERRDADQHDVGNGGAQQGQDSAYAEEPRGKKRARAEDLF